MTTKLLIIAAVITIFLWLFIRECKKDNSKEPEIKLRIDHKYFYNYRDAIRYYQKEVFRCRKNLMVYIYDTETDTILCKKKCSEYFNDKIKYI